MHRAIRHEPPTDCLFCMVSRQPSEYLAWYDQPLLKEDGVGVAIPAVGAFLPGYVLVSPILHESATQRLPRTIAATFVGFLDQVVARVESAFGPTTIFEHGSCPSGERRRSACLTHSHVHIVPGSYSFDSLGLPTRHFTHLLEIMEAYEAEPDVGYLMYREPGELIRFARDLGVSQFFRRHIARQLGQPDEWDYALYPHWSNVRATRDRLAVREQPTTDLTHLT